MPFGAAAISGYAWPSQRGDIAMNAPVRVFAVALIVAATGVFGDARAASVVDKIVETGEINIGVRRDARPHSYLDANGAPKGYSVDVCTEVVARLRAQLGLTQLRMRFVPVEATDRFQKVADGAVDLHCGAATITLSRREIVDFSIPTFADGASVLTTKGASQDFAALDGKKIGVRLGTTTEKALRGSLASFGMTAEIHPVTDHAEGLRAVETGETDAYFGDQSILFSLLDGSAEKDRLTVSGNTLTLELHGLALPLGDHRFRLEVDRALSHLYETGRMAEIFSANFPDAEPGDSIRYIHTFAPIPP
jgi:polar amino acid transport system substrate-binding protein/glutamate/aspartate transport system substrate-binding protein